MGRGGGERGPHRYQGRGAHRDLRSQSQAQGQRGHLVSCTGLGLGLGDPEELTARNWEATLLRQSQKQVGRLRLAVPAPAMS